MQIKIGTKFVVIIAIAAMMAIHFGGFGRDKSGTKTAQAENIPLQPLWKPSLATGQVWETEGTGFEPALHCCKQHFQCCAFNHSATPPGVGEW